MERFMARVIHEPEVQLRLAVPGDEDAIEAIRETCRHAGLGNDDAVARYLRLKRTVAYIASAWRNYLHEDVGYVLLRCRPEEVVIGDLAVLPWVRRKGVGSKLLATAERKLTPERPRIVARVHGGDLDAQLFFRSCGLRCEAVHRGLDLYQFARGGDLRSFTLYDEDGEVRRGQDPAQAV